MPIDRPLSPLWVDPSALRRDPHDPFLGIHHVTIFVRDQDASIRFYVDMLGFNLAGEARFDSGGRWVAVAPPDGSTLLALVTPAPDADDYALVGKSRDVTFVTEDVETKYVDWRARGVEFLHPPITPIWGGTYTTFRDPDGNSFAIIGYDAVSRDLDAKRRAIAERLEADRRAEQEIAIAKQVQARLFPQRSPSARTLDYGGVCIQARQVGGDYYDFLDLGRGRLGLVLGDISGKGIAAALLMANLQANLRSQCAIALEDPQELLRSVNQLFFENTADNAYATLFFAVYDDETRRITYANCGHLPALVIRSDGSVDRLDSTCPVLGLFDAWPCAVGTCDLASGDTVALYSDGVTEAVDEQGEEFGEWRLVDALLDGRTAPADVLLASTLDRLQGFAAGEQFDDVTLVVARCL